MLLRVGYMHQVQYQLLCFHLYLAAGGPSFNISDKTIQCMEFKNATLVKKDVSLHISCIRQSELVSYKKLFKIKLV